MRLSPRTAIVKVSGMRQGPELLSSIWSPRGGRAVPVNAVVVKFPSGAHALFPLASPVV